MPRINLYCLQYEGETYYVEASSMSDAVELWKGACFPERPEFEGEPEGIQLIDDAPVIRREWDEAEHQKQLKIKTRAVALSGSGG